MKKNILILLLGLFFVITACNKEHDKPYETQDKDSSQFDYDYIIIREDHFADSITFFYDENDRLLRVDHCQSPTSCGVWDIEYSENLVKNWNGNYLIDSNKVILSPNSPESYDEYREYSFQDGYIDYSKYVYRGFLKEETYFMVQEGAILKDSTVVYNQGDPYALSTVNQYTIADTLRPNFMVPISGLLEFSTSSKYLVREFKSCFYLDDQMDPLYLLYKYDYKIESHKVTQILRMYEFENTEPFSTDTSFYWTNKQ